MIKASEDDDQKADGREGWKRNREVTLGGSMTCQGWSLVDQRVKLSDLFLAVLDRAGLADPQFFFSYH